jgi:hypothetical protein
VGTITIKQGCRLVTKETTVQTPLITTSTNIISPKVVNFKPVNLSYTIPNVEDEEVKATIWSKVENIKGTLPLTKIREALDSQIPLFTNEDQRLTYVESKYGLFSTNFWWNILLTVGLVFMISMTIRRLLNLNYGRILRITRRKRTKTDHIEPSEMQNLNPELPDNS